jgi:hypothetical protein
MSSQPFPSEQSAADVCLPVSGEKCPESFGPAYGIGETPLAVLLPIRLRPTARTRKISKRSSHRKFCGWCRWCEVSLHSKTKPRKDCSDACRKQFERHGCTKAVRDALKEITGEIVGTGKWKQAVLTAEIRNKFAPEKKDQVAVQLVGVHLPSQPVPRTLLGPESKLGKLTAPPEPTPITFEHHKVVQARKKTVAANMETPADRLLNVIFGRRRGRV